MPPIDNISAVVPCFCVSAIESILLCRFWEPPRTGKVLPKFLTNVFLFYTAEDVRGAPAPQLPTPFSSTVSVKVNFFFVTVVQK